ncbi:MAG: hypothetical protein HY692_09310, partial [Cyanobacteria bacterium NC_groundwater_1444_Ag_S-0.65um_54_12]|nr:hypothetical protein [Cyanobacteria bacterium NC_groundwater_1444_Ag_S-0.65um_54_12]
MSIEHRHESRAGSGAWYDKGQENRVSWPSGEFGVSINLAEPKVIPAGSYFAYLESDERDLILLRELDGQRTPQIASLIRTNSHYSLVDFEFSPSGQQLFCIVKDYLAKQDEMSLVVIDCHGYVKKFGGFTSVFASWLQNGAKILVRSHSCSREGGTIWVLDTLGWECRDLDETSELFSQLGIYDPEFLLTFKKQNFNERS